MASEKEMRNIGEAHPMKSGDGLYSYSNNSYLQVPESLHLINYSSLWCKLGSRRELERVLSFKNWFFGV